MARMNDDPMSAAALESCLRAVAWLEEAAPHGADRLADEAARAADAHAPVLRALGHGLVAAYVVEDDAGFRRVANGELAAAGLSRDELHAVATRNLEAEWVPL